MADFPAYVMAFLGLFRSGIGYAFRPSRPFRQEAYVSLVSKRSTKLVSKSPENKLDELNSQLRGHPRAFRRVIESSLESKSRRKRSAERPVSSSLKSMSGR